jgi:hypothetical protein
MSYGAVLGVIRDARARQRRHWAASLVAGGVIAASVAGALLASGGTGRPAAGIAEASHSAATKRPGWCMVTRERNTSPTRTVARGTCTPKLVDTLAAYLAARTPKGDTVTGWSWVRVRTEGGASFPQSQLARPSHAQQTS